MKTPGTTASPPSDHEGRRSAPATIARLAEEEGSVATEYGLLAVVAATVVGVVLDWATSGGISGLLDRVLARVGSIVGI